MPNQSDWEGLLEQLSHDQIDVLFERLKAARAMAERRQRTRGEVDDAAQTAGVSATTLYRDIRRLEGQGTIRDLVARPRGFPKGRSRLHARQEELIQQLLRTHYLSVHRPPLTRTTEKIGDACEKEGLPRPGRAAVIRRLRAIPVRTVKLKREGGKAAEQATPRPGRFEVDAPWEVWQADHTLSDVIVVDAKGDPIGRIWLTVIVDVCTRLVVAFYVGLDPPSTLRIATALDLAVSPKGPWLAERGLDYPWPAEGLPKMIHTDRAREFTSPVFQRALKNQGVHTYLRPPGRTRFGGHVERLIGTLMGRCRMLPGATFNSPSARGKYDSKSAARMTIDEVELFFAHQILGVYHNTLHSALGMSPLEAWALKTKNLVVMLPIDARGFRLDLFPELRRTIGRQGIQAFGEFYCSAALTAAYIKGVTDVRVKFDPRDLSRLYVKLPDLGYTEVPYRFARPGPAPTLWLLKAARRSRLPGETVGDAVAARRAAERAERLIEQGAKKPGAAARQAERLRRDRKAAVKARTTLALPPPPSPPVDDDWGGFFGDS
ncbi:MAG: DDE-type integrase/transposase/recombinase [Caulobacteraceae bacterium]